MTQNRRSPWSPRGELAGSTNHGDEHEREHQSLQLHHQPDPQPLRINQRPHAGCHKQEIASTTRQVNGVRTTVRSRSSASSSRLIRSNASAGSKRNNAFSTANRHPRSRTRCLRVIVLGVIAAESTCNWVMMSTSGHGDGLHRANSSSPVRPTSKSPGPHEDGVSGFPGGVTLG